MLKRIFALLLSAVLLLGLLAGCSKNQPDGTNEQSPSVQPPAADTEANAATSGTKYAYVPTYIDLPSDASGVDAICLAGDSLILSATFLSGYSVDPDGNAPINLSRGFTASTSTRRNGIPSRPTPRPHMHRRKHRTTS